MVALVVSRMYGAIKLANMVKISKLSLIIAELPKNKILNNN